MKTFLCAIFLWCISQAVFAMEAENKESEIELAKNALKSFLMNDLGGAANYDELRDKFAYIDPVEMKKRWNREASVVAPIFFMWDSDPLVVVEDFGEFNVEDYSSKKATISVAFKRVAHTKGEGLGGIPGSEDPREFIVTPSKQERVVYQLIIRDGKWIVLNPPDARVYRCALIDLYEKDISESKARHAELASLGRFNNEAKKVQGSILEYKNQQVNTLKSIGPCESANVVAP